MLTKSILNKAVEQNIVCFDDEGKPGVLTHRLVGIMIDVARMNYNEILTQIYIPIKVDFDDDYYITFCGLKVHQIPELNPRGELLKYYLEDLRASLYFTRGDRYLVVATGPNESVMLGSIE